MVRLNIPEQTARNLLEYINEFVDNTSNTNARGNTGQDEDQEGNGQECRDTEQYVK